MYGLPLYVPGERIRWLGEACEVIKRLWTEPVATYDGRHYQLATATCEPKPVQKPHPPFVIGGSGEQLTLRVVARHAAIWNFAGGPVEEFQRKSAVLDGHCAAIGRDPTTIERSVQVMVDPTALDTVRATLRSFIVAGATHLILNLVAPYPEGIVQRLADEVAAPLRAEHEGSAQP